MLFVSLTLYLIQHLYFLERIDLKLNYLTGTLPVNNGSLYFLGEKGLFQVNISVLSFVLNSTLIPDYPLFFLGLTQNQRK